MTGSELKAWRKSQKLTQTGAAAKLGITDRQWRSYETGAAPIPENVVELCGDIALTMPKEQRLAYAELLVPSLKRASQLLPPERIPPTDCVSATWNPKDISPEQLDAAMQRDPLYGTTAAECRAIRERWAYEHGYITKDGANVGDKGISQTPLIPLQPVWRRVGNRYVNAAIPEPVDKAPPYWAGPRGVVTRSGRVFDYETAHEMRDYG